MRWNELTWRILIYYLVEFQKFITAHCYRYLGRNVKFQVLMLIITEYWPPPSPVLPSCYYEIKCGVNWTLVVIIISIVIVINEQNITGILSSQVCLSSLLNETEFTSWKYQSMKTCLLKCGHVIQLLYNKIALLPSPKHLQIKQDRQRTHDIILRRAQITVVAVEKQ